MSEKLVVERVTLYFSPELVEGNGRHRGLVGGASIPLEMLPDRLQRSILYQLRKLCKEQSIPNRYLRGSL